MRKFNLLWLFMMFFVINGFSQNGSVPELIYYKFNTVGTSVMNEASTPVGTNPAPITGLTIGSGGMMSTNGLLGTGQSSTVVNTGWNTDMSGDFTIAFWTSNVPSSATLYYIFGDAGASSFRCFTNGVAGANNWMVRGPFPDLALNGAATTTSNMMHVVYDASALTVTGYIDGVQVSQVAVPSALNVTGTGLTVGGYGASSGLNGVLDEFRWYDRALSPLEISNTYNVQLPLNRASNDAAVLSVDSPQVFCAGSQNIIATIGNYGGNQIDSVDVHWEIDGVAQPTFQYIGLLDTVNGSNPNTAQVTLGSYNFPSGLTEIKVYTSNPNGLADTVNINDTATVMVGPALNGVYTVNSAQATGGTNYQSFGELINVLNTFGVCAPVTVDVVANSGPYNEVLAFGNIPGSSSINTIRINGNGNTVEYTNTSTDRQMLTLNGTQYLTIDSLNFKTLDATYGWGALITGGSAHDSIMNCEFDLSSITGTSSANSSGIIFSGSATSATTTGNNGSHCYIGNNYLKATTGSGGPYYGVVIAGSSDSNIVVNNTIENVYLYSMYVNGSTGSKIMYNDINRAGKTTVTTFYGIYTTGITAGVEIVGNRIHRPYGGSSSSTSTCYAMYLLGDGTASEPVIIANNAIYKLNQGGTMRGIYLSTAPYNKVYHNTINLDENLSSATANHGIYTIGTNTGTEIKNNNISITGGGTGDKYGFYYSTAASIDDAQKNNIYVNSTQGGTQYYGYYASAYSTQADFHLAHPTLEVNSPIEDPSYTNATTGNLKPTNSLLIGVGENLFSLVPEDITGRSRSLVPTIGAYEGELTSNDAAVLSVDSPNVFCAGVENIVATISNAGMNQLDSVEVHWEIDGVAQPSLNYTQLLDTAGGSNPRTAQVTLGSHNFQGLTEIKVWTSMPNGVADTSSQNDTVQVFVAPSLSGAYTVNAAQATGGSNYSSFGDLLNDLHGFGICGPITVDVAAGSGSYNEQVIFRTISGASATNTITINGNGETIEFAPSSADMRILGFDNASYINIKNFKVVGLDATYGYGIHFTNSSHHISIDSTEVDLSLATSTSSLNVGGIISSGSATSMSTTGNNASNISITNSKVDGGTSGMYYGVRFNGNSTSDLDSLIRFENNEVANFYAYGIYLYHIKNSYVGGNDVHRADKQTVTTFYGIYTGGGSTNDTINANMIHNTHGSATSTTGAAYGFYSSSNDAEASAPNLFVNNLLYDFNSGSGTVYAIYNLGSDNQAYVNNTISLDHVDATGGITRGFYQSTAASGITFANNNVSITRGGTGIKHGLYFNTATSTITSDYNNIYLNSLGSGAQYVGRESGTDQATLANWQTTSYDGNSESVNPIFTDAIGGDLTPNEQLLNGTGFNYGVPVDFYGVARNNPPDIGAIEFEPANLNASISQVVSPSGGLCPGSINIILEVSNRGLLDLDSVSIYWDVNGVLDSMKYIGTINSNSSVNVTLPSLSFSSSQLYDLKFYTSWPNGLADERPKDDTLMLSALRTGFSGVYTLDPSQAASVSNFTSFDALTQDLSNYGICGPTTVNVAPGTYTDDLYISNIPGASSSNYLVIDGGDSSQTIISQGSQYASLTFDDVQHVKVMNMTIENTSTSGAAVNFSNGSRYDTLSNSVTRVDVTSISSSVRNIVFSASTTSMTSGADVNYNVIQNNRVIGGYYGFYLYGSTTNLNTYNHVLNNEIDSIYYYGIYAYYQDSLEVVGNSFKMLSRGNIQADGVYMINSYNPRVDANYVWAPDYGVYVSSGTVNYAASTRRAQFVNNMIYSESDYGLYLYYVDRADIWHNSIHVEGTVTPALQINATSSAPISEYDVRNNILSSVNTEAMETNEPDTIFVKLDNNLYNSGGPVLLNIDGTGYATLAGYQSVQPSFNTVSLEGNPQFVSNTDLHILGSFVNDMGDGTIGVTEDIDGDTRPMPGAANVDIGADEFDPPSCPRPLNFSYYNSSIDSVTVAWDGDISAGDYEIEIVDCGDPQGSGTTSVIVGDSVTLGGLTPNLCYEIYVREVCSRGDTSLWSDAFKFGLRDSCESFDNYVLGPVDAQSILIDGWDNAQGDAEVSDDYASSGSNSLKIHDSGPSGYSDVIANLDTYTSGKWNISIDFLIPQGNGGYYNILHNYLGGGGSVWAIETYLDASGVATVNEGSNGTGVIGTYNFTPGAWNSISHIIDLDNDTAYLLMNGVPTNVRWQFSLGAPNGNQFNAFNFFSAANAGQTPLMYFDNFCIKAFEEAPVDGAIVGLAAPLDNGLQCYTSTEAVSVDLINAGLDSLDFTVDTAEVTMVISGAASQTLNFTVSDNTLNGGVPLARGESIEVPLGTFDMSTIGTYYFDAIVDITADGVQTNDAYSDSITTQAVEGGMVSDNDSICAGDTTTITLSSYYGAIQWQEFDGTAWVDIIGANEPTVDVDPMNTTEYRALVCGTDVSDTVEVYVTNIQFNVINNPTVVACDSTGTDTLIATTTMNGVEFTWYDAPVDGNIVHEGDTLLFTGSPSSTNQTAADTFYVSGNVGGSGGGAVNIAPQATVTASTCNTGACSTLNDLFLGTCGTQEMWISTSSPPSTVAGTNWIEWNFTQVQSIDSLIIHHGSGTTRSLTGATVQYWDGSNWVTHGSFTNLPQQCINRVFIGTLKTDRFRITSFEMNGAGQTSNPNFREIEVIKSAGCESPRQMVIGSVDCAVGLDDNSTVAGNIEVYPNPSNGLFTLNITTEQEENFILSVRDVQGKLIYEENLTVNGAHRDDIDLAGLAKGVYFLQIQNDQATKVEKLIIQ